MKGGKNAIRDLSGHSEFATPKGAMGRLKSNPTAKLTRLIN